MPAKQTLDESLLNTLLLISNTEGQYKSAIASDSSEHAQVIKYNIDQLVEKSLVEVSANKCYLTTSGRKLLVESGLFK